VSENFRLTELEKLGLGYAAVLAEAGVPIFAAEPDGWGEKWNPTGGTGNTGYFFPKGWQKTAPGPEGLDRWERGVALCAVMGVMVDGLDVDPRHGGKKSAKAMRKAGRWPERVARQSTPSGGWHDLIETLDVASLDALDLGIDLKAGRSDGTGRGFLFIAPTVKLSKADNELHAYEWIDPPRLARFIR
jgi:hypothetical protein